MVLKIFLDANNLYHHFNIKENTNKYVFTTSQVCHVQIMAVSCADFYVLELCLSSIHSSVD